MTRFLFVLFTALPFLAFSQLQEGFTSGDYYVKMSNTLNLKLDLDNDVRTFLYKGVEDDYTIEPNTKLRLAVAVNYRFISLKVGWSPNFLAGKDADLKGKTKIFKLSMDMFFKDLMQNFEYNQVIGYYIEDFKDPNLNVIQNANKYIILPDLQTLSITGTTWYRFNKNYSFKAVVNQNEIQTKSAGSFIPSLYYGYFEITNKTTPQDIHSYFALANAGYYYTFVISEKWYSNMGLSAGLGIEFNTLITRVPDENTETTSQNNNMAANTSFQIGLGYNSSRFYSGITLNGSATRRDEKSVINFDSVRGYFKVYVGYRFDAPRSFEKGMDWIEEKNPLRKK